MIFSEESHIMSVAKESEDTSVRRKTKTPRVAALGVFLLIAESQSVRLLLPIISVQPFAYVVANYTCYNRDKKSEDNISHEAFTSFLLEVRQQV